MSRFPAAKSSQALALGAMFTLFGTGAALGQDKQDPKVEGAEPSAADKEPEYRFDFTLFGGGHFFTEDHVLGREKGDDTGTSPAGSGMFGGTLGMHFNRWIGIEGELVGIPTKTRNDATKMWVFGYRASFVLHLSDNYMVQPFLLVGYGGLVSRVSDPNVVKSDNWGFPHAGAGFKVGFTPRIGLRVDGRILVPWTIVKPVVPIGDRIGYTGPDFEVFGGLYIKFGEIEKIHYYSRETIAPRTDKDGDGIPDDVDKCPSEPEDKDGFRDDDGCPDPDNDNDGIPDNLDKCPNDPEDKDGFEDADGCPDLDNDKDGIPDALDKCPNEPEDKDGFQDDDGCPDPDNDSDGIPDAVDKCPLQPETINKYQDEDGCPDEVPPAVKKFTGVIEGINFKTNSAEILPGSWAILDRALKVLQEFTDVNLEISGHTDSKGKAEYNRNLSQRRAESVRTYFVTRGIASSRLTAIGYGKDRPIADNSTSSGRATNRRTEFRLINPGER
jgi:outer membrane protein OmpA-like peptidoglycan-associated protein